MIVVNGRVVAQGSQFSLNDVEVVSATIDIEDVRAHRAKSSRSMQAASSERYYRVEVPFALSAGKFDEVREEDMVGFLTSRNLNIRYHKPEEEIALVFVIYPSLVCAHLPQAWSRVLAVGLPETVAYSRLFPPA